LQLEIFALRHQLGVLQRSVNRPKLNRFDRFLWAWFCAAWDEWRSALCIVKPDTVVAWRRKGFDCFGLGKFAAAKPAARWCRWMSGTGYRESTSTVAKP
jgi:hypothetical protein